MTDKEKLDRCRAALTEILAEHAGNAAKLRDQVTGATTTAFLASARIAAIAIRGLHDTGDVPAAQAIRVTNDALEAAQTAMAIVDADRAEWMLTRDNR